MVLSLIDKDFNYDWDALRAFQMYQSRLLKRAIRDAALSASSVQYREKLTRIRKCETELAAWDQQLRLRQELPAVLRDSADVDKLQAQLLAKQEELNSTRQELDRLTGSTAAKDAPVDLAKLPRNEIVLVYHLGLNHSYLYVVAGGRVTCLLLPDRKELLPTLNRYLKFLRTWPVEDKDGLAAGKELYDILLKPVDGVLPENAAITIVPDQELYRLPMESLVIAVGKRGAEDSRFVLHRGHEIRYSPNLALIRQDALTDATPAQRKRYRAVAFGRKNYRGIEKAAWGQELHDLNGSEPEAASVKSFFQSSGANVGENCTETEFWKAFKEPVDVLHVATHFWIDQKDLMQSGLVLGRSKNTGDDGIVTLSEVRQHPEMNCKLVVLSACDTGALSTSAIEAFDGFARAILENGSSSVVCSLWSVNDESAQYLMRDFYSHWSSGSSTAKSLRMAKQSLLGIRPSLDPVPTRGVQSKKDVSVGFRHPYFWAPLIVYGR